MESNTKAMTAKNAKQIIKKYISGNGIAFEILAWFFILTAAVLGILGTFMAKTDNPFSAKEFSPVYSKNGSYAYLDAVAISDWIYKYETDHSVQVFYTAADYDGYLYMVRMDPAELENMTPQNAWWNGGDRFGTPPEPYRLFGAVKKIPDSKLSDFANVWDLSDEDFKEYFGDKYLNVGSSPAQNRNNFFRLSAVIAGLMWIAMSVISGAINGGAKKSIKKLKSQGKLIQAAEELTGANGFVNDLGCCKATNNFIFGRNTGAALSYNDILWFYERPAPGGSKIAGFRMTAHTRDRKKFKLSNIPAASSKNIIESISQFILMNNKYAIYGYNRENQKEYKTLCKHFEEGGGEE